MPTDISRFIVALVEICEEKKLRAAASESLKGGLIAGTSAALGGLLLGPLGLALGGAMGGAIAATTSAGKFKPVAEILINLPPAKKQLLFNKIQRAFSEIGIEDVMKITMLIASTAKLKELAVRVVINFLSKEMNLRIRA